MEKLVVDEEFIAESVELLHVDSPPMLGEEVEEAVAQIRDLDPESKTFLEEYIASRAG
jgi:hypothetical protein